MIDRIGDRFEIRRYGLRLAAEVDLAVAGEAGRSEAFKLLFAYIAGDLSIVIPGTLITMNSTLTTSYRAL